MQTSRQWMITHEWMVKGNRQTEWIENRGILLWLAFYAGGLGGGLYLVSLFFNNLWGMFIGWFIVAVLKGAFHFTFLGQPTRFWRMILHPQTSWLSRGLLFVLSFTGFGFLQLGISFLWPDQTILISVFKAISAVLALCVAVYTGFVLNNVKGVPFWNLSLLPALFVSCGILGGFGLTVGIGILLPAVNLDTAEMGARIMLVLNAILIATYLVLAAKRDALGKQSVLFQLKGKLALTFWLFVVIFGLAIPLLIAAYSLFAAELTPWVLIIGIICEIVGGAMLRFCVLKSGMYNPLIPHKTLIKK